MGRPAAELIPFHEDRHIPGAQSPVTEESHEVRSGRITGQQFFCELLVQGGLVKNPRRMRSVRLLDNVTQPFGEPPSVGRVLNDPIASLDEGSHRKHEPLTCCAPPVELGSYFASQLLAINADETDDDRRVDEDHSRKAHQLSQPEHINQRTGPLDWVFARA